MCAVNRRPRVRSSTSALARDDHTGALLDHECRAFAQGLDRDAQVKLAGELAAGQHPRLLTALMRSPVPLPPWLAECVAPAWADLQAKARPEKYRLRRQAADRITWLRTIAAQAGAAMPQPRRTATVTRV